ncbi:MAG: recombinase XerD, partial [Planctomycetes bacterium]|nr:recombinase XerD [Planctomycetota bacterium]
MTRKTNSRIPKYRRHKRPRSKDQAFVELDGERHYLGPYDSPESREAYHRLLAEWSANGQQTPSKADDVRVVEVCAKFWDHADVYYRRPDGTPTILERVKITMKPMRELYGRTRAAEFGPNALRAVRQVWIDAGLARQTINDRTGMAKLIFKWAASHELIPGSVYHALRTVEGLRKGRSAARETEPVKPVSQAHIAAIELHVSRQIWGLVQLQLLTGARSGELVIMRPVDLDTSSR